MPTFRSRGEQSKDNECWVSEEGEPSKGSWGRGGLGWEERAQRAPHDIVRGAWRAPLLPNRVHSHDSLQINARMDELKALVKSNYALVCIM